MILGSGMVLGAKHNYHSPRAQEKYLTRSPSFYTYIHIYIYMSLKDAGPYCEYIYSNVLLYMPDKPKVEYT